MADHNPTTPRAKPQSVGRLTAADYFAVVPEPLVFDQAVSDGAFRLWVVLRRHADKADAAHPSRARLGKLLGCSLDTVDRRSRELVDAGWLEMEARFVEGGRTSNSYHLRRGPRTDAATLPGTDAATPSLTDAAQNQSPVGPESLEPELMGPTARDAATAAWEAWWSSYPKRDGRTRGDKKTARAAWDRLSAEDHALAVVGVVHYTAGTDPQFVMDAVRWLRGRRFEEWQVPGRRRSGGREVPRNGPAGSWTAEQQTGEVREGVWTDD